MPKRSMTGSCERPSTGSSGIALRQRMRHDRTASRAISAQSLDRRATVDALQERRPRAPSRVRFMVLPGQCRLPEAERGFARRLPLDGRRLAATVLSRTFRKREKERARQAAPAC